MDGGPEVAIEPACPFVAPSGKCRSARPGSGRHPSEITPSYQGGLILGVPRHAPCQGILLPAMPIGSTGLGRPLIVFITSGCPTLARPPKLPCLWTLSTSVEAICRDRGNVESPAGRGGALMTDSETNGPE